MFWLSVIMASVIPGISLLAYFYLKDRYEAEPLSIVFRVFVSGALLVFPTMMLQRAFILGFGDDPFLHAFVFSAGLEEFLKWFLLYILIYKHRQFDEPYDGIVYAVSLSLGFATLENVLYALLGAPTISSLLMRALLPVSGHALFGVIMGFHLGQAKFAKRGEKKFLAMSLILPLLYHGLFDYILISAKTDWLWIMLPLMIFLWIAGLWRVNRANASSPFRALKTSEEFKI